MFTPVRIALIGPGQGAGGTGLGLYYLRYLAANPLVKLCAIGGRDIQRIESICREVDIRPGDLMLYDENHISDLFQSSEVDGVLIASPTITHYHYIQMGICHSKHLLVDKPMFDTSTFLQNQAVINHSFEEAAKKDIVLATLCQRVALLEYMRLKKPVFQLNVQISTGIKKGAYSYQQLFDYLISHPISILIKLGLVDEHRIAQLRVNKQSNSDFHQLSFSFNYDTIICTIVLKQYSCNNPTSLNITIDGQSYSTKQVQVLQNSKTEITNQGEVILADDFTKLCLDNFVNHLQNRQQPLMINNMESHSIFKFECCLYKAFLDLSEIGDEASK
jgi:hypothetical protein